VTVRWRGHDVADLAISYDGGSSWDVLAVGVGGLAENSLAIVAPTTATAGARVRLSYTGEPVRRSSSDASDGVFSIVPAHRPPAAAHPRLLTMTGAVAQDRLGNHAANAGDVNGDGYDDWVVGAFLSDVGGPDAGQALVFFGGPGADAVADVTLTGEAAGDNFGFTVAGPGDVNGDGYDDVLVGAFINDAAGADAGRAYLFYGGPSPDATADLTLTGAAAGDWFSFWLGGAGDVNGDGYADLVVGAPRNDAGGADAGQATLYLGGAVPDATADLTLTGAAANDRFGYTVAGVGDVNGDGYGDLAVGAILNDGGGDNAGRAYLYFGGAVLDGGADLTLTGAAAGDQFGAAITGADLDGDGHTDVVVTANLADVGGATDAGRAYVYLGGPGLDAVADLTLSGAVAGDQFGISAAGAGDANGDGHEDLLVGAYQNDAGGLDAGRVYLHYGGPGMDAQPDLVLTGEAAGDGFGSAVDGVDVDGDGFHDLLVGAWTNDAGPGNDAGRAYLHRSGRYIVLAPNDDEVWNVGASATVSWLGAEPADLWLSVDGGNTYERLRHAVGGAATNALTLLVPHTPTRFARVKLSPADPSVRGADESDSLFTIESSIALLSLVATLTDAGVELAWATAPGVGPDGLAGYRLFRVGHAQAGTGVRIGPELITESRYVDRDGAAGHTYRLAAVNGLGHELELGRVSLTPLAPLAAWPLPYRGGDLVVSFATGSAPGGGPGEAVVELYDATGRRVRTIARGRFAAGYRTATWDGRRERGGPVSSGIYFLRVTSAGERHHLKVVVAR
jgi:hypothetical protein